MTDAAQSGYVLDASAILALVNDEPGADFVEGLLSLAWMSAVNVSEVLQKAAKDDLWEPGFDSDLEALGVRIESFGRDDARLTAAMWEAAPRAGLSLADRACLALAYRLDLPAVTTDSIWSDLDLGVRIIDARSAD